MITILTDYFLPSYRAGGPIKSLVAIVNLFSENSISYRLVTRNRDFGVDQEFDTPDFFDAAEPSQIHYLSDRSRLNFVLNIFKILRREADIVYLNSLFSLSLSILPVIYISFFMKKQPRVILAPRGELDCGALRIRKQKKLLFLMLSRMTRLYKNVEFQATSDIEFQSIKIYFPRNKVVTLENMSVIGSLLDRRPEYRSKIGSGFNLIYYSRITEKKNLRWLLNIFLRMPIGTTLDVFGPSDPRYLASCKSLVERLQLDNVRFLGPIHSDSSPLADPRYHLLVLPTYGENFGHVIIEALQYNLPVLISRSTPFKHKPEQGIFSLDLCEEDWLFQIKQLSELDDANFNRVIEGVRLYVKAWSSRQSQVAFDYLSLFDAPCEVK